jgi:hypothetical protein
MLLAIGLLVFIATVIGNRFGFFGTRRRPGDDPDLAFRPWPRLPANWRSAQRRDPEDPGYGSPKDPAP